jgi:DNA-binding IscR family transcriptional regulator
VRSEKQNPGEQDRRDLLRAFSDDTQSALLEQLAAGPRTQAELSEGSGLSLSVVSRGVSHLRALGLIASERGRDARHELLCAAEMREVVHAVGRLQNSIIQRRLRDSKARTGQSARAEGKKSPRSATGTRRSGGKRS